MPEISPSLYRALLFLIPTSIAVVISFILKSNLLWALWFCYATAFSGFGLNGETRLEQLYYFLKFTIAGIFLITVGFYLHEYLNDSWWIFCLGLLVTMFLCFYTIAMISQLSIAAPILVYLLIMPISFKSSLVVEMLIPFVCGCILTVLSSYLLPLHRSPYLVSEIDKYLVIRYFRISCAIAIVIFISSLLKLSHPTWAALTVLVVSQGTLGSTIRKAAERFVGTMLGILVGVPVGMYIFHPHEYARFLIVLMFFIAYWIGNKFYYLAVFLFTVSLCGLFFLLSSNNAALVPFMLERLAETVLGVITIIFLELTILPFSIAQIIQKDKAQYWNYIVAAVRSDNSQDFTKYYEKAKKLLEKSKKDFKEYRYEPAGILSGKYQRGMYYLSVFIKFNNLLFVYYKNDKLTEGLKKYLLDLAEKFAVVYDKENIYKLEKIKNPPEEIVGTELFEVIKEMRDIYP